MDAPPKYGRPKQLLSFEECMGGIRETYDARNSTAFVWADAPTEDAVGKIIQDDLSDE